MKLLVLLAPLVSIATALSLIEIPLTPKVGPITAELRESFKLKPFYKKALVIESFPILSSEKVPDASLYEAGHIIQAMLKNRPEILRELGKNKIRFSIMAIDERTCDIPEHSDLTPSTYWNRRARGLGSTPQRPSVSCGTENLLANPGDPYSTESICVHEFAHAIHDTALKTLEPTFNPRLLATYQSAMTKGLWAEKYAATNHHEYWAEAVQSWFGTNREDDHDHNHVNTRAELIAYDPAIAKLCAEVFGENDWVYQRPDHPSRKNEPHLKDLDRSKLKPFKWSKEEQTAYDALPPRK
ncbi:hypothetical protein N9259_00495 [bacterium]|nr:hypothetical protein [Akkermansiaceae bacterium]MDB4387010.1 hypothetical protein [Akkermansiaceae bacterium]MDB4492008.1 hypothetical protein [bacterium]MDB4562516.1 hypothetical protein [Akkermansiaceae bacterium]